MIKIHYLLIMLCASILPAVAATSENSTHVLLDSSQNTYKLTQTLTTHIEPKGSRTAFHFEQWLLNKNPDKAVALLDELKDKTFLTAKFEQSLAPGPEVFWHRLELSIEPEDALNDKYFLVFENAIVTHLDLFLFSNGQLVKNKRLGVADRQLQADEVFRGIFFPIHFENTDRLTLLIRKQSASPSIIPATIYSEDAFANHLYLQFLFWGGSLALLVVIAIYNATIYALVRLKSYVWYLLFYTLSFFYFAGLHGYGRLLWGDNLQSWLGQNIMVLNFAVLWVVLHFARDFLDIHVHAKWHHRQFKWVNWLLLPGLLTSLWVPEYYMIPIFGLMQLTGTLFAISMTLVAYKNNFYPARLFLIAWFFVMTGAAIGMLTFISLIEANFFTMHGFMLGTILELILLSIALADRLRYSEKKAISRAFVDPQTQLPNSSFFRSDYFEAQQNYRDGKRKVLLLIELKGFDYLLGLLGPKGAENAFRSHIGRIARFLNHSEWAQQYKLPDGNESRLIALPGNQLLAIARIEEDLESILLPLVHLAERRIRIGRLDNQLTIQIGVTEYFSNKRNLQESYRHAQLALIKAKSQHKTWASYQKEDEDFFRKKSALLADLRQAIEDDKLTIYIQPQFDCQERHLCGGEVLVRWKHSKQGMIPPGEFIPLAEESDLIFKITKQVLHQAFDWLAEHPQDAEFQLSINLSGIDIQHSELVPYVRWQLQRTQVLPPQITFEVTESAASLDQAIFLSVIEDLKALGFNLAIDDFGTGYSSMSYIQQLNANIIKVDMTFVRDIHNSVVNQNIIKAVIKMAESTGAQVVAEGVETEDELYKLQLLGVHKVQGYLLGKPVPALAFNTHCDKPENRPEA